MYTLIYFFNFFSGVLSLRCCTWAFSACGELGLLSRCSAGKDRGQEEKGMTEDQMVGWHHQLDGQGFGWTPGVGDGQGGLARCGSWGRKESEVAERRN